MSAQLLPGVPSWREPRWYALGVAVVGERVEDLAEELGDLGVGLDAEEVQLEGLRVRAGCQRVCSESRALWGPSSSGLKPVKRKETARSS